MSKELKALEIINIKLKDKDNKYDRKVVNGLDETLYLVKQDELDIIETALKEKEQQDEYIKTLESENLDLNIDDTRMSKVLDIIKRKGIDIKVLIWSNNCAEYNSNAKSCLGYTQEEYYLAVEVLL